MSCVIIDYGSGNLRSAEKALERAGRGLPRAGSVVVSARPEDVLAAERIVLPGVGAFADCLAGLSALPGMLEALDKRVRGDGRPFLGICVGMQLMAEVGREHGSHRGLSWLAGEVVPLVPADPSLKVPHMGWNQLRFPEGRRHPLFAGLAEGDHAYFVHSYHFRPAEEATSIATVEYGAPLVAAVGRDNLVGTQFHPEKSQAPGLALLANFLAWRP